MKTLKFNLCCLALLLLATSCGKKAIEAEDVNTPPESTVAPAPDTSVRDVKASIENKDLAELRKVLQDNGLDLSKIKLEGETALITAIRNNAIEIRDYLLKNNANIEEKNAKGETPLMVAAAIGDMNTIELLLRNKAQLDKINNEGDTALHIAIKNGHEKIAKELLQSGANYKITNEEHLTAYDLAIDFKLKGIELDLRKITLIDFSLPDETTFRDMIVSGDFTIVNRMLAKFPELAKSRENINPLNLTMDIANANSGQQIAFLLLNNGTSVDGQKNADYSPLIRSVMYQKCEFFSLFLTYKPKLELQDKEGRSALIHAVGYNNFEMVDKLLSLGALKEYRDPRGNKIQACDVARAVGKQDLDAKGKEINKSIKKKLSCGFKEWLF